jgi:hypothetical protein
MPMALFWRTSMASSMARFAVSDRRLSNDEARRIPKLIARLPELVERDRNKARSRRKPQPLRFKPVTIGDLTREGKLLEVHCSACRPERHLYLDPEILRLPKRMPVPEVAMRPSVGPPGTAGTPQCCGRSGGPTSRGGSRPRPRIQPSAGHSWTAPHL